MKISNIGIDLIKQFEGCETEAYKCPAGVWTIGYGHIKGVQEGDVITETQAHEMLVEELKEYESYILNAVEVDLNQNQFDAMVSWVYNLGPTNLKSSTLLQELNSKNYNAAAQEITKWNKAGGKVLTGLVRRREAEASLFNEV
jgi:lysozyme